MPLAVPPAALGVAEALDPPPGGRKPERALGRLERHGGLHPVGAGEGDLGRFRLDLDHALIGRRGESLVLLALAQRALGGDLGVVLGDLDLGDLGVELVDQLVQGR